MWRNCCEFHSVRPATGCSTPRRQGREAGRQLAANAGLGLCTRRLQAITRRDLKGLVAVQKEHFQRGVKLIHLATKIERIHCQIMALASQATFHDDINNMCFAEASTSFRTPSHSFFRVYFCAPQPDLFFGAGHVLRPGTASPLNKATCCEAPRLGFRSVRPANCCRWGDQLAWDSAQGDCRLSRCVT